MKIIVLMELRVYLFLLFGTMIVFYLMGYEAPVLAILSQSGDIGWDFIINQMLSIFTNPAFLVALGVSGVSAFLSSGNYSVTFVFPIMLLIILSNIFFLPTSYLMEAQLPMEIKTLITAWFNLLLTLGAVEFVRGGSL